MAPGIIESPANLAPHGRQDCTVGIPSRGKSSSFNGRYLDPECERSMEPMKVAIDDRRWMSFLCSVPDLIPISVTIVIISLNICGIYWQDYGHPNQNSILQALQYAAKAHEIMIIASLTNIIVYRIQHDLSSATGLSFGFLTAGAEFDSPSFIFSKAFLGGTTASLPSKEGLRIFPLSMLLVLCFGLTLVVGPSSAVVMIPQLKWWDVSYSIAFGQDYTDRVYLNYTSQELWPADITNTMYGNISECSPTSPWLNSCAIRALDPLSGFDGWVYKRQAVGRPPNMTITQDGEISRYLTSQGGPPDQSSWTVASTVGFRFANDIEHYWNWELQNSALTTIINRPLIRASFADATFRLKKPLVQAQCQTYLNPDLENGLFAFPHDELLTPPLDEFEMDIWPLPNSFVMRLLENRSSADNITHPVFDWYDTASNFSNQGAPSLGAVLLYRASDSGAYYNALAACSFDGRWAPGGYYLNPTDTLTLRQDSPKPIDVLNGTYKADPKDLVQMRMSLDWADTMNVLVNDPEVPKLTAVEQLLMNWGGPISVEPNEQLLRNPDYAISVEPNSRGKKSLDWRISTTLGLYLTEGLARAFSNLGTASMLYRQARDVNQSYIRLLNNFNVPWSEGYHEGKLDWVSMDDPRWHWNNISHESWDVWAPQHGYTEVVFRLQRHGYGYGYDGIPIKLATAALALYVVVALNHIILMLVRGRRYKGCSSVAEILALAFNSPSSECLQNSGAGIEETRTWKHTVRLREKIEKKMKKRQLHLLLEDPTTTTSPLPKIGIRYA